MDASKAERVLREIEGSSGRRWFLIIRAEVIDIEIDEDEAEQARANVETARAQLR